MTIWVVRDRRVKDTDIVKDVVEWNFNSIYFHAESANRAAFAPEKVWKVEISAQEEKREGR